MNYSCDVCSSCGLTDTEAIRIYVTSAVCIDAVSGHMNDMMTQGTTLNYKIHLNDWLLFSFFFFFLFFFALSVFQLWTVGNETEVV